MIKLFLICTKKNKKMIENYLNLQNDFDLYLPSWYEDEDEVSDFYKKDIETIKNCDIILVIDANFNLYTCAEIYEGYRNQKEIYMIHEVPFYKTMTSVLGIEYQLVSSLDDLPLSKYTKFDNIIQNLKGVKYDLIRKTRLVLNDLNKEPTVIYTSRDNCVFIEWLSDPEKVDYCKYFVQLGLDYDNGCRLKVLYYDEVVCDSYSKDLEKCTYKVNRYLHDFDSLMR